MQNEIKEVFQLFLKWLLATYISELEKRYIPLTPLSGCHKDRILVNQYINDDHPLYNIMEFPHNSVTLEEYCLQK